MKMAMATTKTEARQMISRTKRQSISDLTLFTCGPGTQTRADRQYQRRRGTERTLPGVRNLGRSQQLLDGMRRKLAPLDGNALVQLASDMRLHLCTPFREQRQADDDLDQRVQPEVVFRLHERSAQTQIPQATLDFGR